MTMTDPIADMLTRIRNANSAQHDTVRMPGSKLKVSLADILQREGFIADYKVEPNHGKPGTTLEITMKYSGDRTRTIAGIKRVSKPGLRIYARADGMPRVLGGMGVAVVSTGGGLSCGSGTPRSTRTFTASENSKQYMAAWFLSSAWLFGGSTLTFVCTAISGLLPCDL